MNHRRMMRVAVAAVLALSSGAGMAASDYLLEIKGVQGESGAADASQPIEVASWSWGASNPSSVGAGGLSAGRASAQDPTAVADTAQAASSDAKGTPKRPSSATWDLATNKGARTAAPSAGGSTGAAEPQVGDVATLVVRLRESPSRPSTGTTTVKREACATGEHIGTVVLTSKGRRYEMSDVVVTACSATPDGMRQKELKGHVTLIK